MSVGISAVGGASNETLTAALTVLQNILLELDNKLEAGQLVGLEPADIAALQTVTATVVNWQTDYPDAGTQTRLDTVNTNLGTVNTNLGTVASDITSGLGTDGTGITQPTGGTGARGWLSGIYNLLKNGSIAVSGTFWQATQPVSGTVTTSPPSHASTNIDQLNGTTVDTNSGNKSAGTQRIVLATDQPQLTNALKVDGSGVTQPVSGSVTATKSTGATSSVPSQPAVSTTSATVLAANSNRKLAVIVNNNSVGAYIKAGATASSSSYTYYLQPSGGTLVEDTYNGKFDAVLVSGTGVLAVTEITA